MRTLRREEVERLGESGSRVRFYGRHAFDEVFQELFRAVRRRRIREAGQGPGPRPHVVDVGLRLNRPTDAFEAPAPPHRELLFFPAVAGYLIFCPSSWICEVFSLNMGI